MIPNSECHKEEKGGQWEKVVKFHNVQGVERTSEKRERKVLQKEEGNMGRKTEFRRYGICLMLMEEEREGEFRWWLKCGEWK